MDSITRIKDFIQGTFPEWDKIGFSEYNEDIDFKKNLCELYRINSEETILIAFTNISITGSDRPKPQLRVFLDDYKNLFDFAKKHQLRFYLLSIFTKDDEMARGLNNFNPKEYIISIETNLDIENSRRDLRSIYDYANERLNGRKFLKCTRANYKVDINQASLIYIGSPDKPYKEAFENFINIFDSRPYQNVVTNCSKLVNDEISVRTVSFDKNLLTAMRTKPFLLLAGISGTGKSRIVKQMAFECCPETAALRSDKTSPGNYQLIEVKPNWHDSTEVLGYESEIGGKHYVVTPFVKFLVKAMCYEDKAPFFVCMDEMNLAPVEQYFAEFLSVLESRKLVDGKITSEPLIKADIFNKYGNDLKAALFDLKKAEDNIYGTATSDEAADYGSYNEVYDRLMTEGLRLPSNLIVVGTVNMDETTHQFSRKVIDRAMTIEMNIEDEETPFIDFFGKSGDLSYPQEVQPKDLFLPTVVQASEAMAQLPEDDSKHLQDNIPTMLLNLNKALNGTPFKIAYRVQNELVLYYYALRKEQPDTPAEELLAKAMEAILMLKVLPRIEGDEDLLEKPLDKLAEFVAPYQEASKKVAEMQARLKQAHFASFWP